ncbi:MIP/aquaporin family protein [Reyranella sp.]|uniref:aquaporin n=1 Tax=Reyranella sp. TaxID=1929291 RepID=UPI0011FF2C61|nr:MIP/aquaporin family protein [Reyranella sp.]TAJ83477.1 MAG: aquaporin family protein [Reyranella sp.]
MLTASLRPALIAEMLGSALLLAGVVGSGIMAERLCGGNVGLALLANAIATGGVLFALIVMFGPVSGAHFNPAVTLALVLRGHSPRSAILPYVAVQVVGAILGVWLAHLMFDLPILQASTKVRSGIGQWTAEVTATFGLVLLILIGVRRRLEALPAAVAVYIVGAYWFTASTSFANPAVTVARALTDTFAGIAPTDAPAFIAAQIVGAMLAFAIAPLLDRS